MTEQQEPYMIHRAEVYERLRAPFDQTYTKDIGGRKLTYVSGEQVVSRLNEVLGFDGWSFEVKANGVNVLTDEVWAVGSLAIFLGDRTIVREQAGGQIINRTRAGEIIELSNDIKGAITDCLKKCASLIGVGLYLSERSGGATTSGATQAPRSGQPSADIVVDVEGVPICQLSREGRMCGAQVKGWDANGDNPARDAYWVAGWQIRRAEYGMPLCLGHQIGVKKGEVERVRWTRDTAADGIVLTRSGREAAEGDYAALADQAIDAGHAKADRLKTTRPSDLTDDVLLESIRQLEAFLAKREALVS